MKVILNEEEWKKLLKAPIYVALLAVNFKGNISNTEKKEAIELIHIRTYTSHIELRKFYKEAEINFSENLDSINNNLPKGIKERKIALKENLEEIQTILSKLDKVYQDLLNESLQSFARHIVHVEDGFLEEMTIPIFMDYLNKKIDKQDYTK